MKQLFSIIFILTLSINSGAQTPVNENTSLLVETTAAWCGPCGNWGTPFWEQMIADPYTGYHSMFVTIHPSWYTHSDSNELNYTLFSQVANDWATLVDPWTFFPLYSHNLVDYTATAATAGDAYNAMMDARDTFISHDAIASVGFTFKRTGNKFDITTRTRFWKNATGDYYVCAYLLEDSVLHEQSGSANTLDTMRYIMRTSMSSSGSSWGDEIVNGNVNAWQFFNKSFSFTVTDPSWDVTKMKAIVIIYKKSGVKYSYVNGYNIATATSPDPTEVKEALLSPADFTISPNPANSFTTLTINAAKNMQATITITNTLGQLVHSLGTKDLTTGENTIRISTENMPAGNYIVTVNTAGENIAKRLVVTK